MSIWLRALRARQWLKNILVFLPLVFSHRWAEGELLTKSVLAFLVFSMGASAIYLLNDLLDIEADRQHPDKCQRPLAAGQITPRAAWIALGLLLLGSASIALWVVSGRFLLVILLYIVSAAGYSLGLKKLLLIDAILLAGFYTLRIFAGSIATGILVSEWLLLFSLFFFFGLAFQKRYAELREWQDTETTLNRRGYLKVDTEHVGQLGQIASYLAVLILALYIHAPEVSSHYAHPKVLWWVLPCLLYWTSRIWLLAGRGELKEDAISFALRDIPSYACALIVILVTFLADPV